MSQIQNLPPLDRSSIFSTWLNKIVQWWNNHDNGTYAWTNVNALNSNIGGSVGPYLPLAGGTLTGNLTINTTLLQQVFGGAGGSNTQTFNVATPAANTVITFGDPGGNDSVIYQTAIQTITGKAISSSQITGTTTNNNSPSGNIGEYVNSSVTRASRVNSAATGVWGDITNISLTAGDWDVSGVIEVLLSGSVQTSISVGIGTGSGTSSAGLTEGDTWIDGYPALSTSDNTLTIPSVRVSIASTTPMYLKVLVFFSAGQPTAYGRISARRVR